MFTNGLTSTVGTPAFQGRNHAKNKARDEAHRRGRERRRLSLIQRYGLPAESTLTEARQRHHQQTANSRVRRQDFAAKLGLPKNTPWKRLFEIGRQDAFGKFERTITLGGVPYAVIRDLRPDALLALTQAHQLAEQRGVAGPPLGAPIGVLREAAHRLRAKPLPGADNGRTSQENAHLNCAV